MVSCALQAAAASREPFEKRSLAPHDPGHVTCINKQRLRMGAGRFIRNREQRSMGVVPAGALRPNGTVGTRSARLAFSPF